MVSRHQTAAVVSGPHGSSTLGPSVGGGLLVPPQAQIAANGGGSHRSSSQGQGSSGSGSALLHAVTGLAVSQGQVVGSSCNSAGVQRGARGLSSSGSAVLQSVVAGSNQVSAGVVSSLVHDAVRVVFAANTHRMIKWIPKSARRACSASLAKVLKAVAEDPWAENKWIELLIFGKYVLSLPDGVPAPAQRSRTISKRISQRCHDLDTLSLQSRIDLLVQEANSVRNHSARKRPAPADEMLARRVSQKLEEGNFRGAVNAVRSEDTFAPFSQENVTALKSKHPNAPANRRAYASPAQCMKDVQAVDVRSIQKALFSFPAGSAAGPDGLTPQHVKDLFRLDGCSGPLTESIASFTNVILQGSIPETIKHLFFSARLTAFSKKDGGLRPIAVGLTLRRLVAKLAAVQALGAVKSNFTPLQLGVGVSRGLEAGVHAARQFMCNLSPGQALVKIDFANAFNTVRRDSLLECVYRSTPGIYPFVHAAYAIESPLFYGGETLLSAEGVQQGDPLGPLLFSLVTLPLLTTSQLPLKFGYLDDLTLGGDISSLDASVQQLRTEAAALGLVLNDAKCEIICSQTDSACLPTQLGNFVTVPPEQACLLGVPLSTADALTSALEKRVASLKYMASRLRLLHAQDATLILRHSFSTPFIQHLLRGIFCGDCQVLDTYDETLRATLAQILNVQLDDKTWQQASLPISAGGLGIRSAVVLSSSAFLSSIHGAQDLVSQILNDTSLLQRDHLIQRASQLWSRQVGTNVSSVPISQPSLQKSWDSRVAETTYQTLLQSAADDYTRARLLAVAAPHAGDWLKVIPASSLGLRLDNEGMRVAVGLRLGANLCTPFSCTCGKQVDARGAHGLSCVKSAGRQSRHALLNDVVLRAFGRAGIPVSREPTGLIPGSSLRPDGCSVVPWSRGKCIAWDVTCPDTLAASNLSGSASLAGHAAEHAAAAKHQKYQQLAASHTFLPIAIETLGGINAEALNELNILGSRIIATTGDSRERMFLYQQLSMAVQRGNIACFTGSLCQDLFFNTNDEN